MKCPKCNYTSFDYNQNCPKCGNDNSEEQARLKFSPDKPNPPFFLASLLGTEDAKIAEVMGRNGRGNAGENAFGDTDTQDLLIALDDMDGADSKEPDLAPTEQDEDEILFELDSEEEDDLSLEDKPFIEQHIADTALDAKQMRSFASEATARPKRSDDGLAAETKDDTEPSATPESKTAPLRTEPSEIEEHDDSGLLLSLDEILENDTKPEPSLSGKAEEEEILFELDEQPESDDQRAGKGYSEEIVFESEETPDRKTSAVDEREGDKGFWNSDDINRELILSDMEEIEGKGIDTTTTKTPGNGNEANPFSDLDIEPLDLELSLDDLEKKSE